MTADRKTLTTHVTLSKRTIPKPLASSKEETRKKWKMEGEGVEEGEIEFAKKASTLPFTLDQTVYLVQLSVCLGSGRSAKGYHFAAVLSVRSWKKRRCV